MKKIKIDAFNDGMIKVGLFEPNYKTMTKEFRVLYTLHHSKAYLRQEDKRKVDEEGEITSKIKVPRNGFINSRHTIEIDKAYYSVKKVDHENGTTYVYLSNYLDSMQDVVEIFKLERQSSLDEPVYISVFKKFCTISNSYSSGSSLNMASSTINLIVNYDYDLEEMDNGKLKALVNGIELKIKSMRNVDLKNQFLELVCELWE